MKKHLKNRELTKRRVMVYIVVVIVLAMMIETFALSVFNKNTYSKTMELIANQVSSVLESNETDEAGMLESLKAEYKVRAKAVAHFLVYNPETETDVTELVKLSELMEIDEINIFDSTGTIIAGTEPKYYGYNFDSGEQISYFKPMLEDKTLSMCQDVTPNTAEDKEIMYAITWNETGTEMVQVGIQPTRLLEELQTNEISEVVADMTGYQGYSIYVADSNTTEVKGATDKNILGSMLGNLGLGVTTEDMEASSFKIINKDGFRTYVKCGLSGAYAIIIVHSTQKDVLHFVIVELSMLLYLLVAAGIIYHTFAKLLETNREKENQLFILKSMADIYYSVHLIKLKEDILVEYKAVNEVKEIANHEKGAYQMVYDTISNVVKEEYLDYVLKFTDLRTLPDRMKGKKIITIQFIGKHIGWSQASFISLKTGEDGKPTEVMFVTRSIENQKKKEEALIRSSNTDELTQVLNRRAYEMDMNSVETNFDNLVYVALDLNGLKKVNDTMGHAAGDELLKGAADCIRNVFEKYGKVFRIGGDEFVALITINDEKLPLIKDEFDYVVKNWSGKLDFSLSISYGYATHEDGCKDLMQMAMLADRRMYENKAVYYKTEGIDRRTH